MDQIKICYAASAGGHTYELLQLGELLDRYPSILITESKSVAREFDAVYTLELVNRRSLRYLLRFAKSIFSIWGILKRERPTHIVSFGAMCTVPVCLIGKLMGMKVIHVESFTRIEDLSLTGKILYPVADLVLVQWRQLALKYPKAVFGGALF